MFKNTGKLGVDGRGNFCLRSTESSEASLAVQIQELSLKTREAFGQAGMSLSLKRPVA